MCLLWQIWSFTMFQLERFSLMSSSLLKAKPHAHTYSLDEATGQRSGARFGSVFIACAFFSRFVDVLLYLSFHLYNWIKNYIMLQIYGCVRCRPLVVFVANCLFLLNYGLVFQQVFGPNILRVAFSVILFGYSIRTQSFDGWSISGHL